MKIEAQSDIALEIGGNLSALLRGERFEMSVNKTKTEITFANGEKAKVKAGFWGKVKIV